MPLIPLFPVKNQYMVWARKLDVSAAWPCAHASKEENEREILSLGCFFLKLGVPFWVPI